MGQIPGEAEDTDMNKAYSLLSTMILANNFQANKWYNASLVSHWLRISLPGRHMGLISGSVRYHEPQKNLACMPKEVSLCFRAQELNYSAQALQLQKPEHPGAHVLEKEKPLQ